MTSSYLFLDIDTQRIFLNEKKLPPQLSQLKQNLKKLTQHALKQKILIIAFLETKRDASGSLQKKKIFSKSKIAQTIVAKNGSIAENSSSFSYQTMLKKFPQLCVEQSDFDIFSNKHTLPLLKASGIKNCIVYGASLDYGIDLAVLKLLKNGFNVWIPADAVWSVNEENREAVLKELHAAGAHIWNTDSVIANTDTNKKPTERAVLRTEGQKIMTKSLRPKTTLSMGSKFLKNSLN